jgi:hypothetical protein
MRIVQAHQGYIDGVVRLISAATQTMLEHGIYQWDEIYPNEEWCIRESTPRIWTI